jgi:hypothetical protein
MSNRAKRNKRKEKNKRSRRRGTTQNGCHTENWLTPALENRNDVSLAVGVPAEKVKREEERREEKGER